ncbi:cytochrome c biogenesis CcdA family protein [Pseudoxanthobacter sp. M-2]|uniref:cytochrome c biogenesis CcdA family protein n=1 Tax=Pseudoxanthobacter sp. M-2 TaxID=3078754 RepID=UPI0038FCE606
MNAAFAFFAGILSILSPCVLPLVPIVLGTAASEHRFGPVALAAGLALSFMTIGLFVAAVGYSIGLDGTFFRSVGGFLMIGIGAVLLVPVLQQGVATAIGPVSVWAGHQFGRTSQRGLSGQFCMGVLLGAVWAPCVGPTLGAASLLAAKGEDMVSVALTMVVFGVGAALPLLALGLLSREAILRWRGRLLSAGGELKRVFGALIIVVGTLVVTGLDKALEAEMVQSAPGWMVDLSTRF